MQRGQKRTLSQRFDDYQASKTVLFWACAASVIAAIVVGFSWGGWVTGGTAQELAEDSAAQARQELAAVVCVDRFMAAPDAGVQLTALHEMTSARAQGKFVEDGGWAMIVPASSNTDYAARADHREAAGLCAEELAKREMPAAGEAGLTNDEAATAQ
jgi:pimeloyl-ACP methyl ester carboxylesterase